MKNKIVYLIGVAVLAFLCSCSKEEKEPMLVTGEAHISYETGLSFVNSSGFEADKVVYKLRIGAGSEKEYGQSLDGFNYTKLQAGSRTIYQIQVFKNGEHIPFKAYVNNAESTTREIKATSLIEIKEKEIFQILLEAKE